MGMYKDDDSSSEMEDVGSGGRRSRFGGKGGEVEVAKGEREMARDAKMEEILELFG